MADAQRYMADVQELADYAKQSLDYHLVGPDDPIAFIVEGDDIASAAEAYGTTVEEFEYRREIRHEQREQLADNIFVEPLINARDTYRDARTRWQQINDGF